MHSRTWPAPADAPECLLRSDSLGNESIADTWLGRDVARYLRISLELLAQPRDVHVEVVCFRRGDGAPDLLEQHAVGEHLVGIGDERLEQVVFGRRQVNLRSA